MNKMTNEEINNAIAKFHGWSDLKIIGGSRWFGVPPNEQNKGDNYRFIPDCCNDLNETHRAWESLTLAQKKQFEIELYRVVISDGDYNRNDDAMKITNASAKERAMALVATLNLE